MKKLPDILEIQPLTKPPNCTVTVPGSKSITNRALILAALAEGKCTLHGALWADDTQVMIGALKELGFDISHSEPDADSNCIIEIIGRGGEIPAKKAALYVGNAGTAARFLTALVCLGHGEYTIRGDARMHERPMQELFDALRTLGSKIEATNDRLPAVIHAHGLSAREISVSAERSSQFASALMLTSKTCGLTVTMTAPATATTDEFQYFVMTYKMLLNWHLGEYVIEPDLSSASYFTAAAFLTGGRVDVAGLPQSSLQVDAHFPKFLQQPLITQLQAMVHGAIPERVVSRMNDLGDSVMTLAIAALFGQQPMRLTDAARMREQECDRLSAMVTELRRVGARAEEHADGFTVWPAEPGQLHGADIETYNDHRMAMCFAILGLKVPGIRIKNPACVSKTFPNFFDKLEQLRK